MTVRGQWMYPASASVGMVRLIRSGLIDLSQWKVTTFSLDQANDAVTTAAVHSGPFKGVAITP